jgi:uncharacterized protein YjbJ (UPF0337 family)
MTDRKDRTNRPKDDRSMGEKGIGNQIKGGAKQAEGSVRSAIGGLTNNRSQQLKGEAKKVEGKVQRGAGQVQEDLDRETR